MRTLSIAVRLALVPAVLFASPVPAVAATPVVRAGVVSPPVAAPRAVALAQGSSAKVTATCNDGTAYAGSSRKGACSKHGGVRTWGSGAGAGASATCNDGTTYSGSSRRGACSKHGGVKSWNKG